RRKPQPDRLGLVLRQSGRIRVGRDEIVGRRRLHEIARKQRFILPAGLIARRDVDVGASCGLKAVSGAGVEAEVSMQRWSVDPDQYARAAMCESGNVRVVTRTKGLHR